MQENVGKHGIEAWSERFLSEVARVRDGQGVCIASAARVRISDAYISWSNGQ